MPTKAIALLRVSSEAQAGRERQGLPAQREVCARIAETHQLDVIEWVELEGVSGAAVLAEPRFARVLEHLRTGRAKRGSARTAAPETPSSSTHSITSS